MGEVPPRRTPSTFVSPAAEGAPSRAGAALQRGNPPCWVMLLCGRQPSGKLMNYLGTLFPNGDCRIGLRNWNLLVVVLWYGLVWYARQMRVLWAALHKFSCSNFFERACWRPIRGEAPLSLSQHNSQSADCWLQNFLVTSASLGHLFLVSSSARLRLCSVA